MDNRNKKEFRHKGYKGDTIKTIMGNVEYKRAVYLYKDEKNQNKAIFLLDELLEIAEVGKVSANLVEKILSMVVETNSYRDASSQLEENTNQILSHEAIRNIVICEGMKIIEKENQEIIEDKQNQLEAGKKEIPVLFEEADGLWINLQGKDRQNNIEKYSFYIKNVDKNREKTI